MNWAEELRNKGATDEEISQIVARSSKFEDPANLSVERAETLLHALRHESLADKSKGKSIILIVFVFFALAVLVAAILMVAESR